MLEIALVNLELAPSWSAADRSFLVEYSANPRLERGHLLLDPIPVDPYVKTYSVDAHQEAECHVALVDGKVAGELRCGPYWNGYLYVHDLVVGVGYRRQGVGEALVRHSIRRANTMALQGVMLETQNTNWPACCLYERCGFQLGGFDKLLYKALEPSSTELALFWYWTPN
ncbi:GNAT family N-acetyltransferase [Ottowia thiooxydans]|uniref:Streptothricin acetyltransferase n=1 Tax=Ottowia thiooxydans TaxID=219182 RepID=A0ABV2Q9F0_9BURK